MIVFNADPQPFDGYKKISFISRSKNIKFDNKYDATIINEDYVESRPNIMQLTPNGYQFKDELDILS